MPGMLYMNKPPQSVFAYVNNVGGKDHHLHQGLLLQCKYAFHQIEKFRWELQRKNPRHRCYKHRVDQVGYQEDHKQEEFLK